MKKLFLSFFVSAVLAAAAVVECQDGQKVFRSPFNQSQSDAVLCGEAEQPPVGEPSVPEFYVDVFGPRPVAQNYDSYHAYQAARDKWDQDLRYFKGFDLPEWMPREQLASVNDYFSTWGFGPAVVYEGRYGFQAFVRGSSPVEAFQQAAWTLVNSPQNVVATYQMLLAGEGECIEKTERHPWVPDVVFAHCTEGGR